MVNRLVITFLIMGGLGLLWLGWTYYKARLVKTFQPLETPGDKPALLFFTADYCASCKYQQLPIINRLVENFGDSVAVLQYDVTEHPDLAGRYKVLTLPTTIVLDSRGRVADLNYGVTPQNKLETQLAKVIHNQKTRQGVFGEFQHAA